MSWFATYQDFVVIVFGPVLTIALVVMAAGGVVVALLVIFRNASRFDQS